MRATAIPAVDAAYGETLAWDTEVDFTHKKQTGGTGPVRTPQTAP